MPRQRPDGEAQDASGLFNLGCQQPADQLRLGRCYRLLEVGGSSTDR